MEKLLIIDGHNLLFRMFYGIPAPIRNSKGQDIRAVVGFVGGMIKMMNMDDYSKLFVVFDSESSTQSRIEESADYKATRIDYSQIAAEDNPFTQLPYVYKALEAMEIEHIEVQNFEADDYIASLVSKYKEDNHITIASTDRDFLQLVDDNVKVFSPRGKLSIMFDYEKVKEKYSIEPKQIIDYKALIGDKSDNIAGIRGVGPKTAVKILDQATLREILSGKVVIEDKLMNKLIENQSCLEKNIRLITMISNIELEDRDLFFSFDSDVKAFDIINYCGLN